VILKYIDGYGPLEGRENILNLEPSKHDPPAGLVKRIDGFGVETYREKNARGDVFHVICFACDSLWLKTWVGVDLGDQQRIVPKIDGAFRLRHPVYKDLFCPCEASRFATRNQRYRKFASETEVREALGYDLKLSAGSGGRRELDIALGSAGGRNLGG